MLNLPDLPDRPHAEEWRCLSCRYRDNVQRNHFDNSPRGVIQMTGLTTNFITYSNYWLNALQLFVRYLLEF